MSDRQFVWQPAGGRPPVVLDDATAGLRVQWDTEGFSAPPFELLTTKRRGGRHGVEVHGVRAEANDLGLGVMLRAADRPQFVVRSKSLVSAMNPLSGPGRLSVRDGAGGVMRWIDAYCVGGLRGRESAGEGDNLWWRLPLRFLAPDSFWHAPTVVEGWGLKRPAGHPWFPFLDNSPTASLVGGRRTVFVPGDVALRPPWVVQGPGSRLLIANYTAGWRVEIEHDIPASGPASLITVTTEAGEQAVRDGYGANLFGAITNGPRGGWTMGPLLPGKNDVEVRLDDSGDAANVTVTFDPLLLAA